MEGYAVDDTDEEQGPVGTAFCVLDIAAVVYGEEDMGCVFEGRQGRFQGHGVVGLEKHEGHAGAKEDDAGFGVGV